MVENSPQSDNSKNVINDSLAQEQAPALDSAHLRLDSFFIIHREQTPAQFIKRLEFLTEILTSRARKYQETQPLLAEISSSLDQAVRSAWQQTTENAHQALQEQVQKLNGGKRRRPPFVNTEKFINQHIKAHFFDNLCAHLKDDKFFEKISKLLPTAVRLFDLAEEKKQKGSSLRINKRIRAQQSDEEKTSVPPKRNHSEKRKLRLPLRAAQFFVLMSFLSSILVPSAEGQDIDPTPPPGAINEIEELAPEQIEVFLIAYEAGSARVADFSFEKTDGTIVPFFETLIEIHNQINSGAIVGSFIEVASAQLEISQIELVQLISGYNLGFIGGDFDQTEYEAVIRFAEAIFIFEDMESYENFCPEKSRACVAELVSESGEIQRVIGLSPVANLGTSFHEINHLLVPYLSEVPERTLWETSGQATVLEISEDDIDVLVFETSDQTHAVAIDLYQMNEFVAEFLSELGQTVIGYQDEFFYGMSTHTNSIKNRAQVYMIEHPEMLDRLILASRTEDNHLMITTLGEVVLAVEPNFISELLNYPNRDTLYSGYALDNPDLAYVLAELPTVEQAGALFLQEYLFAVRKSKELAGNEIYRDMLVPVRDSGGELGYEILDVTDLASNVLVQSTIEQHSEELATQQREYVFGQVRERVGEELAQQYYQEFLQTGNISSAELTNFEKVALVIEIMSPDLYGEFATDTDPNTQETIELVLQNNLQMINLVNSEVDTGALPYSLSYEHQVIRVGGTLLPLVAPEITISTTSSDWLVSAVLAVTRLSHDIYFIDGPTTQENSYLENVYYTVDRSYYDWRILDRNMRVSITTWFDEDNPESVAHFSALNTTYLSDLLVQLNLRSLMSDEFFDNNLYSQDSFRLLGAIPEAQRTILLDSMRSDPALLQDFSENWFLGVDALSIIGRLLNQDESVSVVPTNQILADNPPYVTQDEYWSEVVTGIAFWEQVIANLDAGLDANGVLPVAVVEDNEVLRLDQYHALDVNNLYSGALITEELGIHLQVGSETLYTE